MRLGFQPAQEQGKSKGCAMSKAVELEPGVSDFNQPRRKPWSTPRVIESAMNSIVEKTPNTFESTFGPFHFGPS